jgi:capsid protein (F protein)|uniref:Major capsid protein n=1 Tax=Microviridae sp. ct46D1 TaxID=2826725 RepID=A0A8S5QNX5_9VIRU|nr:MAG TPA: Major capsid protein [Microviridae sp. ct46D1]
MSKPLQIKPSRANRPRNAFDLSQRHMFTAPVGALLPVLSLDLIPHDHVEIDAQDFMRTMPMNSSAFMSMRGVYEFFFVPYSQLWHPFDQFITGMTDYKTSLLSKKFVSKPPQLIPSISRESLFSAVINDTHIDMFGFDRRPNAIRLLDLLGYGYPVFSRNINPQTKKPVRIDNAYDGKITPFRIAAYQKIYSDFYRNSTYEPVDVESYNFDDASWVKSNNVYVEADGKTFLDRFFKLRYRNAPLDYFTNLRPTPLFDMDQNLLSALKTSAPSILTAGVNNTNTSGFISLATGASTVLDASSIRSAFALDKLLSITMRAGKTYAEQMQAHFGVTVSEGRDGEVVYLGGFDSNIQVGDVTQTSGTTNPSVTDVQQANLAGYLGKITGKGTSSGSGRVTFDAKEHGILMCIYSVVPAMQYDSSRVDPFVTKSTRGEFFIPEFENLGMQPLMMHNVTDVDRWTELRDFANIPRLKNGPLGWQLRYSEYKTAVDVNHGQFAGDGPLSYWTVGRNRSFNAEFTSAKLQLEQLKISPNWVDSIFAVNYNGKEVTDQMFGGCYFGIQKVSDMSVDGLPKV